MKGLVILEIRDLKNFIKVVDQGSFTKAAEEMYVTQSSLSKSVKRLEIHFGSQLIVRIKNNLHLSDIGKIVYQQGREIINSVNDLNLSINQTKNGEYGSILLGIPQLIGTLFFPKIAKEFYESHGNIKIELIENGAKKLERIVTDGKVDIALIVKTQLTKDNYDIYPFIEDEFYIFLNEDHPLANRTEISISELKNEKFIIFPEEFTLHDYIINTCKAHGFFPNILYKSSQWDLILELTASHNAVTLLPKSIYTKNVNKRIKLIKIKGKPLLWSLVFITLKDSYKSFALQSFIKNIDSFKP